MINGRALNSVHLEDNQSDIKQIINDAGVRDRNFLATSSATNFNESNL